MIAIIRRARTLRRDHCRAERIFRGAFLAKCGTMMRLLQALQNFTRDTQRRFLCDDLAHSKASLGVELLKLRAQAPAAHGDHANAAPLSVTLHETLY